MYQKKIQEGIRCPLEYGMEIFGGKWKARIICVLAEKKLLRYSELRSEMVNITDAVLASALKELIANDIIQRRQFDEIPPRVEYCLTEKGMSVVPILQGICRWAGIYYQKESDQFLAQCKKCNYRGGSRTVTEIFCIKGRPGLKNLAGFFDAKNFLLLYLQQM